METAYSNCCLKTFLSSDPTYEAWKHVDVVEIEEVKE